MAITLDYENSAQLPWTLVAQVGDAIIAAVCKSDLTEAQDTLDLLLIELGYDIYTEETI
jgi:hypothetical protein